LTDEQWARIAPLLPQVRPGPQSKIGDRMFINAVIYRAKTGIPWRDMPERFGPWKSVYNRFANWAKAGVWELMFAALAIELEEDDEEGSIVDASIIRAHQDAAGGKGGSREMLWDALAEAFQRRSTPS
jgi:putative transposase